MICKNCGCEFEGRYCNNCGQKNIEGRFTLRETVHNFFHTFTHVDSGILFLCKELFVRPGIVAREYIEGKRQKYFNPYQYLIITVAISYFVAVNFSLFGPKGDFETIRHLSDTERWGIQFNDFIYKFYNIILFLSVPITALYSKLIFRKSGYNYSENLIFNAFIAGQRNIIYLLISPFIYVFMKKWYIVIAAYYLLWNVYFAFSYVQFFEGKKIITILKYVCVLLLMFISFQSISMLVFTLFFFK